jgi:hypothetical protein
VRTPGRFAAGVLGALLLLLVVARVRPASAAPGPVVVQGKVVNGTAGGTVPDGTTVTIVQLDGDLAEKARKTVRAGPGGAFRSDGWDGNAGNRFVASVDHANVSYGGSGTGEGGTVETDVTIYETTSDESVVQVASDTLAVVPAAGEVLEALEILRLVNRSDRTYVGDPSAQPPVVLKLPVPGGAYDLTPQEGAGSGLSKSDAGVTTADPLPPGESLVSFLYRVKVPAGAWKLQRPVWYPTARANVLLGPGLTLDAPGFEYKGTVPLENRSYGRWDGPSSLKPGRELSATIGSDRAGSGLSWGLAAGLALLVLAVVAVPLLLRRRRKRSERTRLIEEIAALDDALEDGSVSAEEHATRRGALKRRLVDLAGEERRGRRTIVVPDAEADEARR